MQPLSREQIDWTHEALRHFYDLPFLERHCRAAVSDGRFADGHALQEALSDMAKRLRPSVQIPAHSPAWRVYNVLNLRYVQGLAPSEVADHLSIGSRQLRREQLKVTEAVAALLFDQAARPAQPATPATTEEAGAESAAEGADTAPSGVRQSDVIRLDELLLTSLRVLDPLLQRQDLHVKVIGSGGPPVAKANRMITRQVLISALNWWINGLVRCNAVIRIDTAGGQVHMRFTPCDMDDTPGSTATPGEPCEGRVEVADVQAGEDEGPFAALCQLALGLPAGLDVLSASAGRRGLVLNLPAFEMDCVVLIDDNPDAAQLVRRYLQQSSEYYLVAITHPDEAFHRVLALQPACILLDVMMPERDGWELLTLFRTHPETASIPIIVSSVLKEDELAASLGASAILPKPFSAPQLRAVLHSVITLAHAHVKPG